MNRLLAFPLVVMLAGLVAHSAQARQAPGATRTKVDVSKLGPQVGDRVPDFNLTDQHGQTRTISSIMGSKGAMLVFVRSADW